MNFRIINCPLMVCVYPARIFFIYNAIADARISEISGYVIIATKEHLSMIEKKFDIAILGGGPGGYVAAIRASQLGMSVGLIEKQFLGGTCGNAGCIPTKALIQSAHTYELAKGAKTFGVKTGDVEFDWASFMKYKTRCVVKLRKGVESLMLKNKIEVINGFGVLKNPETIEVDGIQVKSKNIILATGSHSRSLPSLPVDGRKIITSDHALELEILPKRILIVGAGAIGCEFAYIFSSVGVDVTIVEFLDRALPMEDKDISLEFEQALKRRKIKLHTSASVEGVQNTDTGVISRVKPRDGSDEFKIETDMVLVSVGRGPSTSGCGFEEVGIEMNRGFIKVDEYMRTGVGNIRAIGDAVGGLMLAHKASAEGILAVDTIAGIERKPIVMDNIPRATYSQPEVASVGLNEDVAQERYGRTARTGKFPFAGIGKAVVIREAAGFAKLISGGEDGKLVGAHIIGPHATDLIATASTAINLGASAGDFVHVIQA
ncbi:MAG: dihydrolipoyl dehydrogenase, partial [bacterium]|nr:dihydrolipoyl dehydrogenase [bacterium]